MTRTVTGTDDVVLPEVTTHDLGPARRPEGGPWNGDLDPDIALWPDTELQRWPWTGPPTSGTWPLGWLGVDNTATVWICTGGGTPGAWHALAAGVTLPPSNGVDDTATIQNAINAVSAALAGTTALGIIRGDPTSVYQVPGYTQTVTGIIDVVQAGLVLTSNVKLQGVNIQVPSMGNNYIFYPAICIPNGTTYVAVDHCTFNGSVIPGSGNDVEGTQSAILSGYASDVWISDNVCHNFSQSFVFALGDNASNFPTRYWVSDNYVFSCGSGYIKFDGGAADIWVTDNQLENMSHNGLAESILFNNTAQLNTNINIIGNRLLQVGQIDLFSCNNGIIRDNFVTYATGGAASYAIQCQSANNLTIANNTCDLSNNASISQAPIYCVNTSSYPNDGILITGNQIICAGSGSNGIQTNSGAMMTNVVISNNHIRGLGGINAQSIQTPIVIGNTVTWTLNVQNCFNGGVIANNNVIAPTATYGIIFGGTSSPTGTNVEATVVTGNKVTVGVTGLRITTARTICSNNTFFSSTGATLNVSAAVDPSVFVNNFVRNSGPSGTALYSEGAASLNNRLIDNVFVSDNGPITFTFGTSSTTIVRGNVGYNPVGAVTVAVPASGTAVASVAYDRTFYVTGGTGGVTIAVSNGPTVTVPAAAVVPIVCPARQTLTPTYTTAPTWTVQGL